MNLDPGIAPFVEALQAEGVETFESCEGGPGHAFLEPTIRFHGGQGEGHRALGLALGMGLPVAELRRSWPVQDGEPTGPCWELTFYRPATNPTQTEAKPESLKEEPSAAAEPAAARSVSEGEGLAARVERLAERMTGLARKQADEFGNYVSQGQFSADYKEGLASAYDDSAEALRSLLVPKEEA